MEHPATQGTNPSDWLTTDKPTLHPGEIHVWRATLVASDADIPRFEVCLSVDEQRRANQFRFQRDRRRFVVRRAVARALLAQYLGTQPSLLAFVYGSYGKPELAPPFHSVGLCFSMSHSQDLALFAVAYNRAVGVDVERITALTDATAIARGHFSEEETLALNRLEPDARIQAFFDCWTRSEAYLKATGEGLAGLDSFATAEPGCLRVSGESHQLGPWSIRGLAPAPGFIGAIAGAGDEWTVRCWHWGAQIF
jgi:4'-phosphopantetheinyl transferase